ncbi:hypothetical protein D3C76_680250 [compost metagenome]
MRCAAGIAVEHRILALLAEHLSGFLEQPLDRWVIGLDKGCRHVRQVPQTAPLVARQQLQGQLSARYLYTRGIGAFSLGTEDKAQGGVLRLGQTCQQRAVDLQIKARNGPEHIGVERMQVPGLRLEDLWISSESQFQLAEASLGLVVHAQFTDHRDSILEVGQVELGDQRGVNLNRLFHYRLNRFGDRSAVKGLGAHLGQIRCVIHTPLLHVRHPSAPIQPDSGEPDEVPSIPLIQEKSCHVCRQYASLRWAANLSIIHKAAASLTSQGSGRSSHRLAASLRSNTQRVIARIGLIR